jgi:hypothetical protein
MNGRALSIAAAIAVVLGAGCGPPEFQNPLSDPASAKADARLEGVWISIGDKEENTLTFKTVDAATMHLAVSGNPPDEFTMFPTTLDGRTYMNLKAASPTQEVGRNYLIVLYEFTADGRLQLRLLRSEAFQQAIEQGKLHGTLSGSGNDKEVLVTESTDKLAEFIRSGDPAQLFDEPLLLRKGESR